MSNTGWAATILAIIIVLGGVWWYMSARAPATDMPTTTDTTQGTGTTPTDTTGGDTGTATQTPGAEVHYSTASGFTPKSVTVNVGEKVTFINDGTSPMWVGADAHPTHTEFDGTDRATHCSGTYTGPTPFDQCQPGSTYTFVFTKAGTFQYHNHSAAQFEGTVVVK